MTQIILKDYWSFVTKDLFDLGYIYVLEENFSLSFFFFNDHQHRT